MPAVVIPIRSSPVRAAHESGRSATWSLLEVARPGHPAEPLGILLVDAGTGHLTLRLRDVTEFAELEEDEADYLAALADDLKIKGNEPGRGGALVDLFEGSLSGFLRIGDRTAISYSGDAERTVNALYDDHVDSEVRPFRTHLPLYGLRAAATQFGEAFDPTELAEPDAWVRVPQELRLAEGMFVAQVVGRSMEPLIPDGSFCVFRGPVTGSRQGKRLLIEQLGGSGDDRYTVKRYTSRKSFDDEGNWQHEGIRLEPLNPEFPAFELGAGDFRVIAEFVQVLDS